MTEHVDVAVGEIESLVAGATALLLGSGHVADGAVAHAIALLDLVAVRLDALAVVVRTGR